MPVVDVQMRLCPGFLLAVRHDVGGEPDRSSAARGCGGLLLGLDANLTGIERAASDFLSGHRDHSGGTLEVATWGSTNDFQHLSYRLFSARCYVDSDHSCVLGVQGARVVPYLPGQHRVRRKDVEL